MDGAHEPMPSSTFRDPADALRVATREPDASQGAREARALAEIVQEINQSPELDRVFALIARHASEIPNRRRIRAALRSE